MVGPMLGGVLYAGVGGATPFALGAALLVLTIGLFFRATREASTSVAPSVS
jgi:hypothetical protein